eukprot:244469_1
MNNNEIDALKIVFEQTCDAEDSHCFPFSYCIYIDKKIFPNLNHSMYHTNCLTFDSNATDFQCEPYGLMGYICTKTLDVTHIFNYYVGIYVNGKHVSPNEIDFNDLNLYPPKT